MRAILLFILLAPATCLAQCLPPSARATLDVNNAKVMMQNGGDMWTDLWGARCEVPSGLGANSLGWGSLWIAGKGEAGQVHSALINYRLYGTDFIPGPLASAGNVDGNTCADADRIYKLNRHEVAQFRRRYSDSRFEIPIDIKEWPARGNPFSKFEADAPFIDVDGDSLYNPTKGDYPAFSFTGEVDLDYHLLGDQCLWWVMNDAGVRGTNHPHPDMNLEIQCMAYGFESCDQMNDQTLYRYKISNKGRNDFSQSYVGVLARASLGVETDNFIGSEVMRHLGYTYNADSIDGGEEAWYGSYPGNPPSAGINVLRGPIADVADGIDNNRNGEVDEVDETHRLSKFLPRMLYEFGPTFNDDYSPEQLYGQLSGVWSSGHQLYYGDDGHPLNGPDTLVEADFIYPGDSDPQGFGTGLLPQPPWWEDSSITSPWFRSLMCSSGPFTFEAGDTETLHFANLFAWDRYGPEPFSSVEKLFLVSDTVEAYFNSGFQEMGCCPPTARIGMEKSNRFTFLFSPLSEGNEYEWDFGDGRTSTEVFPIHRYRSTGTFEVCLKATNECGVSDTCISITIEPEYLTLPMTRLEGTGNGGRILDLLPSMHDSILNSAEHRAYHLKYECGRGPIGIDILDTNLFPKGDMRLEFTGVSDSSLWKLYEVGGLDTVYSDSIISLGETQLVPQWGMMVSVSQTEPCGNSDAPCGLDASTKSLRPLSDWFYGLEDTDYPDMSNWIRSGRVEGVDYSGLDDEEHFERFATSGWAPYRMVSSSGLHYSGFQSLGVGWEKFRSLSSLDKLASVDLVITNDQAKWSRCAVIETGPHELMQTAGDRAEFTLRDHPSVDKDGLPDNSGTRGMGWFPGYAINVETGERLNIMFGENSALENQNSRDLIWNPTSVVDSGGVPVVGGGHYIYIMGHNEFEEGDGVPIYDEGKFIYEKLSYNDFHPTDPEMRRVYQDAMWVHVPISKTEDFSLRSEVRVRLRVNSPYAKYGTLDGVINHSLPTYSFKLEPCVLENVEPVPEDMNLVMFPNPSNGVFQISGGWINIIRIYDTSGKLVFEENENGSNFQINLKVGAGTYFATIFREGSWEVKKLVVRD